jgi:hypothetical protein
MFYEVLGENVLLIPGLCRLYMQYSSVTDVSAQGHDNMGTLYIPVSVGTVAVVNRYDHCSFM